MWHHHGFKYSAARRESGGVRDSASILATNSTTHRSALHGHLLAAAVRDGSGARVCECASVSVTIFRVYCH